MAKKITDILDAVGLPYALVSFPTTSATFTPPAPPFICYLPRGSDNFAADNGVYQRLEQYDIELYTDAKDLDKEQLIRDALDAAEIFYQTTEQSIPDDRLYEVVFSFELEVD